MREEQGVSEAGAQSVMGRMTSEETRFVGKGLMMQDFHGLANKSAVCSKSHREPLMNFTIRNANERK